MSEGQQEARTHGSTSSSDLLSGANRGKLKAETSSLLPLRTFALKLWQTISQHAGRGLTVGCCLALQVASPELLPGGHHLRFLPTAAAV